MRGLSAGRVLAVASAVPALALAGWLLAGLPLLMLGWFRPQVVVPLGLAAAILLCRYGLRRLPEPAPATGWQTAGVLAIALGSGVFSAVLHSEQLIVRRDPATYAQYATWLATRGSLPIPYGEAAFGGRDPALRFGSVGFYDHAGAVVPQFMPGPPMLHAIGHWLGGLPGLLLTPPVLGALAVLVFAGTAARLAGPRLSPPAALAFAVGLPILYTSRASFSEIPSLIMIFGGMSLLLDARARLRAARDAMVAAALAGLVFGLAVLVRIDGLRDVLPVLVYAGLLIALRRIEGREEAPGLRRDGLPEGPGLRGDGRLGVPLLAGLLAGAGLGLLAAVVLAAPYLDYLSGSLLPLLAVCAAVLLLTAVAAALAPRLAGPLGRLARVRRLPGLAAGAVVLVMGLFAARPWLQTVTRHATTSEDLLTSDFIEKTQAANGLPVDGSRLYYEDALHWVAWYIGPPAVVLATLAGAVLVHRLLRGTASEWLLPLMIVGWTTVTTLYRPAITPDHPFAARRLVPVIIPGLVLLAVWGLRWIGEKAREREAGRNDRDAAETTRKDHEAARTEIAGRGDRFAAPLLRLAASRTGAVLGVVLLVVPPAVTSIGTAFTPVGRGERAAVEAMCAALPENASVLLVERVTADRFTQLVRGVCGLPAAGVEVPHGEDTPAPADVTRLIGRIREAGRVPVLLAAEPAQLTPYGAPVQTLALRTRQDERSLVKAPDGTWSLSIDVWMTVA
ncbi:hypothetical protein Pta02_28930 [Planobispora takensis]|uniref:Glycosyltransferase RgtA/B/C/D-like domain-containing protein n=1 Tax=Planobispora takensis TaxID=1367882 RepID=A0A8J3SZ17_9ACTN|nr:hypothetical protein Pta02_28930 [Planobispora takensis]